MYRLRAEVTIAPTRASTSAAAPAPRPKAPSPTRATPPSAGASTAPAPAPRRHRLGRASASPTASPKPGSNSSPTTATSLKPGFERLHGVDFRKGCYVGQEVTARMKHKTELRKGLATVQVEGPPPSAPRSSRPTARRPAPSTPSRRPRHRLPALRPGGRPDDRGRRHRAACPTGGRVVTPFRPQSGGRPCPPSSTRSPTISRRPR